MRKIYAQLKCWVLSFYDTSFVLGWIERSASTIRLITNILSIVLNCSILSDKVIIK